MIQNPRSKIQDGLNFAAFVEECMHALIYLGSWMLDFGSQKRQ
jgi:hypothetical protein